MLDATKEWLEFYVAEEFRRVSAGADLTTKMLQRAREQIAKSLDILRSSEVPKVWHPEPPGNIPIAIMGINSPTENMGHGISLAINRE